MSSDAVAFVYPADREIAGVWADAGEVPEDQGARTHAALLCSRFLAAYDLLAGSLDVILEKARAFDELCATANPNPALETAYIVGQGDLFGEGL